MDRHEMALDIERTPFSAYGSYLSFTLDQGSRILTIHNVRRRFEEGEAWKLEFLEKGEPLALGVSATPSCLSLHAGSGSAIIHLRGDRGFALRGSGIEPCLRQLGKSGYGVCDGAGSYKFISASHRIYTGLRLLSGQGRLEGPVVPGPSGQSRDHRRNLFMGNPWGSVEFLFEMSIDEPGQSFESYDPEKEIASLEDEWQAFQARWPAVPEGHREMADIALYTIWSCFVRAGDVYAYDAVLMSKKGMTSVWPWDHCFNALALAAIDGETALEQFFLPFERQSKDGALPDMLNPNTESIWGITKPPIHGWCFGKLMDSLPMTEATLRKAYGHIERWTEWWFAFRDSDGDGLPEYPHGYDSGWDNSTCFDGGFFIESPDLSAYLVLQMGALSRMARELGDSDAASAWARRADTLVEKLLSHFWKDGGLVTNPSGSHEFRERPTSLLPLMTIALGAGLEKTKFDSLVDSLERDFLTEKGPATERPDSPWYQGDGYWRGPIWAPSTYILVDGLRRGGRQDLAAGLASRFCRMVREARGCYENFDALTGRGLEAPGYTWTASVYILLLLEFPSP
jgi:hypothetical protein